MPNERKTEKLVRSHFEKFESKGEIYIEEQISENETINEILKSATKKALVMLLENRNL